MFTHKDIEFRSVFVINCLEERSFKVAQGELLLTETKTGRTLTKFPFQKILAIFIIGHATITTPLIEKCRRYNVFISIMKPNLRPVFTFSTNAEANFLLREKQYSFDVGDLSIAKHITKNKITNQKQLLINTRRRDDLTLKAIGVCDLSYQLIDSASSLRELMGNEGLASRHFFSAYFHDLNWRERQPRIKSDVLNATLDIGYSILFNFIETFARMFGFDLYKGVYHRQWFKRKSLICDLVEPFRCIIDRQVRKSFNLNQFSAEHFKTIKNEFYLKIENNGLYYSTFYNALIGFKVDIFNYIRAYYRYFMNHNNPFPKFTI